MPVEQKKVGVLCRRAKRQPDFTGTDALDSRVVLQLKSDLTRCGNFDFCSHEDSNNA